MSSTEKKNKKVALPTSLLLYKRRKKKSINSGLTYLALALDPTLHYSTRQGKKKKAEVPAKRNFPFLLLRIERVYESLSLTFISSFFFSSCSFILSLAISANDVYT